MPATSLADLYSQKLQLLLDAEQQGLDAIPQLAQAVHDPKLRDTLQMTVGLPLPELSMGMTGDADAAVAEGATLVRIGTAIFGPRPHR